MNFCSHCACPVVFERIEGDHLPRYICHTCQKIHYQNPRVIVGCLPVFNGKVLLCRRGIHPQLGFWNLVGGFMENNENIMEGAAREAAEEAHIDLELIHLLSVFTVSRINQVHIHFLAEMKTPNFELTPESTEIAFFDPKDIPWNEIAFQSNLFALRSWLENLANGQYKTHVGSYELPTF
jgi:ADP-ribose pyrophosphatase YjhB (NUDIX family)